MSIRALIFDFGGVLMELLGPGHVESWARRLALDPIVLDQALWGEHWRALERGQIPAQLKVHTERGAPLFEVKFVKNTLGLRWHAQVGMPAEEFEIVDRTLRGQGYMRLFAEAYLNSERATRFVAAWRR